LQIEVIIHTSQQGVDMKVTELRDLLETLEATGHGETEVMFAYNYGDHWRTQVAVTISDATEELVTYSDYHSMNKVVESGYGDYQEEQENKADPKNRIAIVLG
jgi:hypothetical protein